jgi:hypothetical protein
LSIDQWSFVAAASRLRGVQAATKRRFKVGVGRWPGRGPIVFVLCKSVKSLVLVDYPKCRRSGCVDRYSDVSSSSSSSYDQRSYQVHPRYPRRLGRIRAIAEVCVAAGHHDRHRPSHLTRHGPPSRTRRPRLFHQRLHLVPICAVFEKKTAASPRILGAEGQAKSSL